MSSTDVEGWANGASRGGRSEEREQEAMLWSTFPDYRREFERTVIDPPMAAIQWHITGSSAELEMQVDLAGTTIIEFDDDARIRRFWLHYHDPFRPA